MNSLTRCGDKLYFRAGDGKVGQELWMSDGTKAGTKLVKDIRKGKPSSHPQNMTLVGSTVYFTAEIPLFGRELYKSDGSKGPGTSLVANINPGKEGSNPNHLTDVNGTLMFVAETLNAGIELWKSDGTAVGTVMVKDINPGPTGSAPRSLVSANGKLFFTADVVGPGRELWVSDGTATGTNLVKDLLPGAGSGIGMMVQAGMGSRVVFRGRDTATDWELFVSDGTAAGTVRVVDVRKGAAGSDVQSIRACIGRILFQADDGKVGSELHAVPMKAVGGTWIANYGKGCAGGSGKIPAMKSDGSPTLGAKTFSAVITDSRPAAPCALLVGIKISLPIGNGCTILAHSLVEILATTSAAGLAKFPIPIPNNTFVLGAKVAFTGAVIDPGGKAFGAAGVADGLEIIVGR